MAENAWWAADTADLLHQLSSSEAGLVSADATRRRPGHTRATGGGQTWRLLLSQFTTPLVLILIVGAVLSLVLGEYVDAGIILVIVAGSGLLGFTQEHAASQAVQELRQRLVRKVRLLRDGKATSLALDEVVPGDVALLKAGDLVPGDGRILASESLLVDEAVLTGEPFPLEKSPLRSAEDTPLAQRTGALFRGTSIRSGNCRMLVVATGAETVFGSIEHELEKAEETTEFARGLAGFGAMLMRVMLAVVALVLVTAMLLGRDLMDSLLFAMALAVAISPQLLPAIVSVTLATGARRMARHGVLVRRLQAIENLGGMDILCTDKTGTLTVGAISLSAAVRPEGDLSNDVLRLAAINSRLQTSMESVLDEAILFAASAAGAATGDVKKLHDVPYDFTRRRYSVEAGLPDGSSQFITKGAVNEVLSGCTSAKLATGIAPMDAALHDRLQSFVQSKADGGFRVLALATGQEGQACLEGFLLFLDPPKPGIERSIGAMHGRGVSVRIISGDNRHVSARMARVVGLEAGEVLTGEVIAKLDDDALAARISDIRVFAEIEPQQKERLVHAFQKAGHSVGYMGDGINDSPALRAADVGISVDTAVDVARESADIVLLHPDLRAILRGIEDGRRTFANTLKYIAIEISSNFGNMISIAVATVALPFLPLLPVQILLNNFLSDLAAISIAGDAVDSERLASPQRWDIRRVRNFMFVFGLVSTAFDLMTFAFLRLVAHASPEIFRTTWFVLSLLTQLAALLVLRTRRRVWRSRPSRLLLWSAVFVAIVALSLPYSGRVGALFAFAPLPPELVALVIGIVSAYALVTELLKRRLDLHGNGTDRAGSVET